MLWNGWSVIRLVWRNSNEICLSHLKDQVRFQAGMLSLFVWFYSGLRVGLFHRIKGAHLEGAYHGNRSVVYILITHLFKVGRDVKIVYDQSESESLINENKSISGALQITKSFTICMYKRNNMKISEWTSLVFNSSMLTSTKILSKI